MSAEVSILAVNSGSSSLKFGVYKVEGNDESLQVSGSIDSIGHGGGKLKLKDSDGRAIQERTADIRSLPEAFSMAIKELDSVRERPLDAIGHRVVHGGPNLRRHVRLDGDTLATLKGAVHFAPLHDPPAIAIIEAAQRQFPNLPQALCLDTAFHATLPEIASHYALPEKYWEQGVMRYGFHGLSYESIVRKLGDKLPQRMVVAHLGNGASLAAIQQGKSIDTSMGLTPVGGIPMGTRCGDLDPSIILWLLRDGLSTDEIESLINHQAGLLALSSGESDMRNLEAAAKSGDSSARLAVDIFARSVAKTAAAYIISLGGIDAFVFTGGIGENSAPVRMEVCKLLASLGFEIDDVANQRSAAVISAPCSRAAVHVIPADEDGQIARHTRRILFG